jgi:hypothetical protein
MKIFPGEIQGPKPTASKVFDAMPSYRVTRRLKPSEAAYIAGLIDGEGTVTLTRHHKGESRRLVVSVANTELKLLRFLVERIGTGRITKKCTTSDRHTPSFCYAVRSRQALALLQQVTPYLLSYKRQRALMALASYEALTPRNGKYSAEGKELRSTFEAAFLSLSPSSTCACDSVQLHSQPTVPSRVEACEDAIQSAGR